MSHITEEQSEWIYTRYDGDMINCANAVARQAVVSYIDQQARELPVLPDPRIAEEEWFPRLRAGTDFYTVDQLKAYGAACAAHARDMALSEAMQVCKQLEAAIDGGGNTYYRPADARQCVSAIEVLKGK